MKRGSNRIIWYVIMGLIFLVGGYASFERFYFGLGKSTHLSDFLPWGLWIWLNLTRIAISSCGFIICAGYFILHIESLRDLVKPAILIGFTGYFLVGVGLLYDIGLPLHFWHPVVMWNFRSAMFEVAWCLMLYTVILGIELGIPITEGLGWTRISGFLKRLCVLLAIAGFILSVLHQSSFGTLFVLTPEKLNGLWYSKWLPYLFLFSSLSSGIGFLSLQIFLAEGSFGRILDDDWIRIMSRTLRGFLWIYVFVFLADFIRSGKWDLFFKDFKISVWFAVEILFNPIIPLVLLSLPGFRGTRRCLCISSFLVLAGVALNRLNVVVIGYLIESGGFYFPSLEEFAIAIMLFTMSIVLITMISRFFPIFPKVPSGD